MRTRTRTICAGLVLAAALVGGVAWATIPSDGGVYTACKLNATGTIRLIDPSAASTSLLSHCNATYETQISWNQKGPAGAAGTNGAAGPKGDQGNPGSNGLNGRDGAAGANGDPGAGFTWRGPFQDGVQYFVGDVVTSLGSAWISSADNGTGTAPPDSPWQLLAAKGNAGTNGLNGAAGGAGAQGPVGAQGPAGPQGPTGGIGPQGPASAPDGVYKHTARGTSNAVPILTGNVNLSALTPAYTIETLDLPPGQWMVTVEWEIINQAGSFILQDNVRNGQCAFADDRVRWVVGTGEIKRLTMTQVASGRVPLLCSTFGADSSTGAAEIIFTAIKLGNVITQ